jgi:L-lysine 2,3-aminomutase
MKYISYNNHSFKKTKYYNRLSKAQQDDFDLLSNIFYFKTNNYVLDNLIDWDNLEEDPMFRLNFLHKNILSEADYQHLLGLYKAGASIDALQPFIELVRKKTTPQIPYDEKCFPTSGGERIKGLYRSFNNVISLFPDPMLKTCHAYCSYCFRWIAFNNTEVQSYTSYKDPQTPVEYLKANPEINETLFTGADPLTLTAAKIQEYVDPLLEIDSVKTIRFNTKALTWWPFRFTTDKDAENILDLFRHIVASGRKLTFCAHLTHVKELQNDYVIEAVKNIQATGAQIICQGPVVEGINDTIEDWVNLWSQEVALGLQPYYMFVELNHNAEASFRIPLAKAVHIFQEAEKRVKGLEQPFNGPVFMNDVHCVSIDEVTNDNDEKQFALKCLASPYAESEGQVKHIPYDKDTRSAGNLVEMFMPEEKA